MPKAARWPEVTTDVAVGQMRAFEFDAIAGDWAIHCHKSHHTMNAMGHEMPNMIGVDMRGVAEKINRLIPDYMAMGDRGMADMGAMEMPLPDNTLPMMTGTGPFGPIEMGGMFSVIKVRDGSRPGDYTRPGLVSASSRDRGARIRRPDAAACIDSRSGRCRAGAAFRSQASSSAALSRRVRCAAPRGALSAHVTGARHRPRVPARRAPHRRAPHRRASPGGRHTAMGSRRRQSRTVPTTAAAVEAANTAILAAANSSAPGKALAAM